MHSKKPFFSIVTVVLNNKEGLRSTIESIKKQENTDLEYIVIDGGSIDGTLDVINENMDVIDFHVSESDAGIFSAMNKGLKFSRGKYVGFINSGDTYLPKILMEVQSVAEQCAADVLYGNLNLVERGEIIAVLNGSENKLFWDMSINHPTCFVKKEIHCMNPFDVNFKLAADYDLMLRLKRNKCRFVKIDRVISEMITGGASSNVRLSILERKKIHQKYYGNIYANFRYISSKIRYLKAAGNIV